MTWLEQDDLGAFVNNAFVNNLIWRTRAKSRRSDLEHAAEMAKIQADREKRQADHDAMMTEFNERLADGYFALRVRLVFQEMQRIRSLPLTEDGERLNAIMQRSYDDARDRPWLKAKPLYVFECVSDEWAAAVLIASLSLDPPR